MKGQPSPNRRLKQAFYILPRRGLCSMYCRTNPASHVAIADSENAAATANGASFDRLLVRRRRGNEALLGEGKAENADLKYGQNESLCLVMMTSKGVACAGK